MVTVAPADFNTVSPVDLIRRIAQGQGEFLLFALTPPRLATDRERAQEIADATAARLRPLGLDGLILYDIHDEAERNPAERPFPFMPTLDPADYLANHLENWPTPVIVYRAVGKYAPEDLRSWFSAQDPARLMTVLVGAASRGAKARTSLAGAQALRREANPTLSLGGVARGHVVHHYARPRPWVVALLKWGIELSQHDSQTLARGQTHRCGRCSNRARFRASASIETPSTSNLQRADRRAAVLAWRGATPCVANE